MKPNLGRDHLLRHPWVVGVAVSPRVLTQPVSALRAACDVVEVRVDQLGDGLETRRDVHALAEAGVPVLVTVRGVGEGGAFNGSDAERVEILNGWAGFASLIDVEMSAGSALLATVRDLASARHALMLGSFHDFGQTPSTRALDELIERGAAEGVDAVKLAVTLRGPADLERMEALVATPRDVPVCVVGMGHLGHESRVSLPLAGSCLTYGHLGEANAPGQPGAAELVNALVGMHPAYGAWRLGPGANPH